MCHSKLAGVLLTLCLLTPSVLGQPPHPRLLFTSADVPALQAKISAGGPATSAYDQMVHSASLQTASSQGSWVVGRSLRRMCEVALRYQMTGNVSYGNNAKSVLMAAVGYLTPMGVGPYRSCTYPCALALTFDLVYDRLSTAQRAQVVAHLEAWVTAMRTGTHNWGGYTSYQDAADNHSTAWCTGIAFTLMGIWGDSSYPGLTNHVTSNLEKLHAGWRDSFSPDGSIDESYGYANYGHLYSINAGIAGINCGFGDYLAGTNALKAPRWVSSSLPVTSATTEFLWVGDSSPSHKGAKMDPVIFYAVNRTQDAAGLWGLNRLITNVPVDQGSPTHAWSQYFNLFVHYPNGLQEQAPEVLSGFFRDNLNQGTAWGNKLRSYPEVGEGGHAFLHNASNVSWPSLTAYYMMRDEWMSHNHEDDGNLGLAINGSWYLCDPGYAQQGSGGWAGSQSADHNIVLTSGASPFNGVGNYYAPPGPNARFLGRKEKSFFSTSFDYVRGSHENMWMMQDADRTLMMVKDAANPYTILVDHVNRDGATHTYEQLFNAVGPMSGSGVAGSTANISGPAGTLRSVWLAPANVDVVPGAAVQSSISYYRNKVRASGSEVSFVSVHGTASPLSQVPLAGAQSNTKGGHIGWSFATDKLLARESGSGMGDAETQADARFVWLRNVGGNLAEWTAAEASSVVHNGQTLLSASAPLMVAARHGRVIIATPSGNGAQGLSLLLNVPFTASELVVDDVAVAFTQNGSEITLGGSVGNGPGIPEPSEDDRAYTFRSGWLWDAVPSPNVFVNNLERATSVQGWASLDLKGGEQVGGRPLSLGMDVALANGAAGAEAGLQLLGSQVLSVLASPNNQVSFAARIVHEGSTLATADLPLDVLNQGQGRLNLEVRPLVGQATLYGPTGEAVTTVSFPPFAGTVVVRALTTEFASIDNITFFDSEEDGVTPQGVCFWATPGGIAGFNLRMPQFMLMQNACVAYNREEQTSEHAMQWFTNGGLEERVANKYIAMGSPTPSTLLEAGWEFEVPSVHLTLAHEVGIFVTTALGQNLYGAYGQ